jgi:hypothetical protein
VGDLLLRGRGLSCHARPLARSPTASLAIL